MSNYISGISVVGTRHLVGPMSKGLRVRRGYTKALCGRTVSVEMDNLSETMQKRLREQSSSVPVCQVCAKKSKA